ncbi:hypothetical protein ACTXT7_000055 [Hymenolepis weldensis]
MSMHLADKSIPGFYNLKLAHYKGWTLPPSIQHSLFASQKTLPIADYFAPICCQNAARSRRSKKRIKTNAAIKHGDKATEQFPTLLSFIYGALRSFYNRRMSVGSQRLLIAEDAYQNVSTNLHSPNRNIQVVNKAEKQPKFTYSAGLILSLIGCVMGTGNVWRFPRIIAVTSSDTGSLTFLIAWACFLLTWSIPLIITEYSIGRFTRSSPTIAFQRFMGDKFIWIGCWVSAVAFFIGAYFSVVVGWCLYYVYVACAWQELPATEPESPTLLNPKLYVEAACQNGFDTAAGMGLLSAYAAYFSRNTGAVLYGYHLWFDNFFYCLFNPHSNVTDTHYPSNRSNYKGDRAREYWINFYMDSGAHVETGFYGENFVWLVLHLLIFRWPQFNDFIFGTNMRRRWATIAALLLSFLVGVPSALSIDILSNQDFVWGFALILSGLCFCILVISYNPFKFRKVIVNDFGINDWNLPYFFVFIIAGLVPLEALGLIIWWAYTNIASTKWYELAAESLASTFLEWSILLAAVLVFNFVTYLLKCSIVKPSTKVGFDPHNLSEIPPVENYKLVREIPLSSQNTLVIGDELSTYTNKCFTPLDNLGLEKRE